MPLTLDSFVLTSAGPVNLRWVNEAGDISREARAPGDTLADLPDAARAAIEAGWTPDFIAAYQASQSGGEDNPPPEIFKKADVDVLVEGLQQEGLLTNVKATRIKALLAANR